MLQAPIDDRYVTSRCAALNAKLVSENVIAGQCIDCFVLQCRVRNFDDPIWPSLAGFHQLLPGIQARIEDSRTKQLRSAAHDRFDIPGLWQIQALTDALLGHDRVFVVARHDPDARQNVEVIGLRNRDPSTHDERTASIARAVFSSLATIHITAGDAR